MESKEDMFVDTTDDIEDNQFQEMDNNGETDNEVVQHDRDTEEYTEDASIFFILIFYYSRGIIVT